VEGTQARAVFGVMGAREALAPAKSRRRSGHAFEPRTLNFHKDVFYVEVSLDPSFGPAPDHGA
jgi:hypothetical protein